MTSNLKLYSMLIGMLGKMQKVGPIQKIFNSCKVLNRDHIRSRQWSEMKVTFGKLAKHEEEQLFRRLENFKGLFVYHRHKVVQQVPVGSSASISNRKKKKNVITNFQKSIGAQNDYYINALPLWPAYKLVLHMS